MTDKIFHAGEARLFVQQNPGPSTALEMLGCAKMGAVTIPQGDVTPIYCPDPAAYNAFKKVGKIKGAPGNPTSSLAARLGLVNFLINVKCAFDIQARLGTCKDPQDLKNGWEVIFLLPNAEATSKGIDEMVALEPGDRKAIMTTADVSVDDVLQLDRIAFTRKADTMVDREVVDIIVCDALSCGDCGPVSDGCEKVYALIKTSGASPGIWAEVVYTLDGGITWNEEPIDSLGSNEDPKRFACIGENIVVISNDSCSLHYADKDALGAWAEVGTGFVATKCPNAMFSVDSAHTWIVGDGGYIYFTADPVTGVTVQDAGIASTQILRAVHFLDQERGLVVGNVNTVLVTTNGGITWQSKTGPAVGVSLTACWMDGENRFFVGTEVGRLYYSEDGGDTWTQISFPGSGAGTVWDIRFVAPGSAVGYMAHSTATPAGRILRTLDHGHTWYVLPEGTGSIPANDKINKVAICDQNRIWGGGLADNGSDGIIVAGD